MTLHTLLIKKTKTPSTLKDTETSFGVVVLGEELPTTEAKTPEKQEWDGEDGEDVFIPQRVCVKSQTMSVKCGLKGGRKTWEERMDALMDYLTGFDGSGVEMLLFLPYKHLGRKCRFSKISDIENDVSNDEMLLEFEIEFEIDQPRVRVDAVYDERNETIVDLKERSNGQV